MRVWLAPLSPSTAEPSSVPRLLLPLARALFSADDRGDPATGFDSTHAFVVKYRADEDSHLDVHTDDSDGR